MHSLRLKTTVITIAAALVSLIAFGVASFFTVGRESNLSSAEKMHLVSDNARMTLDSFLVGLEHSVQESSRIAVDALDGMTLVEGGVNLTPLERTEEQSRMLDEHLKAGIERVRGMLGSVSDSMPGVSSYYYCISPNVSERSVGFFYSHKGKVGFENRDPIDVNELSASDIEHDSWYFEPISKGTPTWVGPYKDQYLNEARTVSYVTPIYKTGALIGVLGMDILFDTLIDQIDDLKVYQSGYACLLDSEGRLLYHPSYRIGENPEFMTNLLRTTDFSREGSDGEIIRYEKDGESWQLSFSTLTNGMKIVVAAPVNEVISSWRNLIRTMPLIAAVILILFVPIAMFAMGAVTQPLQQLTNAAHQLASGDYDVELEYRGKGEVGDLTDAFRKLVEHLQVYISNLNSRNFVDSLTGVKTEAAFSITAARMRDEISLADEQEGPSFALVVFRCITLESINGAYGHERGDEHLRTTCALIKKVYARSSIFRMAGDEFVALLQGRDYANRDELLFDFDIMAEAGNRQAKEPWLKIETAKGMATYLAGTDQDMHEVLHRAQERMEEDLLKKGM